MVERREGVTPGLGWEGESLVEHCSVIKKWVGFLFEVSFMFICFLLRELLPLEHLCSIYCIARSQQRHKSSDSNAEDALIGWHSPEHFAIGDIHPFEWKL